MNILLHLYADTYISDIDIEVLFHKKYWNFDNTAEPYQGHMGIPMLHKL